jgi:RNA polymerase-interacting CarD/CdnL/TRCF family regulator
VYIIHKESSGYMTFNVGDTVVKPGLGICKIKAIRKMEVEGSEQQFYVLQSGDVKVMVPFTYAHSGGLRPLLDEEGIEEVYAFLRQPLLVPEDTEEIDAYAIKVEQSKDEVKQREPITVATLAKTLFYKSKICDLPKAEQELLTTSLAVVAEEIAHVNHTTRQKILFKLRSTLTDGRKARRESSMQS